MWGPLSIRSLFTLLRCHVWAYSEQINTRHRRVMVGMKALPICNRQSVWKIKFEEEPRNTPNARKIYVSSWVLNCGLNYYLWMFARKREGDLRKMLESSKVIHERVSHFTTQRTSNSGRGNFGFKNWHLLAGTKIRYMGFFSSMLLCILSTHQRLLLRPFQFLGDSDKKKEPPYPS
jgi:hypothetical protein